MQVAEKTKKIAQAIEWANQYAIVSSINLHLNASPENLNGTLALEFLDRFFYGEFNYKKQNDGRNNQVD